VKKIHTNRKYDMHVVWEVSSTCNYDCWYCNPRHHDNKIRGHDYDNVIDFFTDLSNKYEYIYCDMVGGEPTLWPRLKDFLVNKPSNMFVLVSTNGSRTINWWEKNLKYFDGVCATFHPDTADADHFYELGMLFSQYPDKALEIILLVYDQVHEKVMDLYNRLEQTDWKINVRIKIVDDRHIGNTQDNLDTIYRSTKDDAVNETLKNGFFIRNDNFYKIGKETEVYVDDKLITMHDAYLMPHREQTNFKGWKCTAGRNSLYIWSDGSIYRGSCMNGGVIGNINFDTSLNIEPWTTCEKLKCFCMDEVLLEKFKP